jgi:putative component of membrane protein insertase Oxa1/YidC/SpoIIIJ protein YidD
VPPNRTPTCKFDGTCNKYAEAKKKHDEEKAEIERIRNIERGLDAHYAKLAYMVKKARHQKG